MKILILGGTGAMGVHVSQLLSNWGNTVVVTTRQHRQSVDDIQYRVGNAKNATFLSTLLEEHWDAIVDFMIWSSADFRERYQDLLAATDQYIFTSSYRVYNDDEVITENSPRLLDTIKDEEYLKTDEYALAKARCENMLMSCGKSNWTIVRPAVTYDGSGRFQLTVLESDAWLWRAVHRIPVPIAEVMLDTEATMSWGGDVARMIALLVGNKMAFGEIFTVSTSEHLTWREISNLYSEVVPLTVTACALDRFERAHPSIYQIKYDRMFNRVIDNSKILAATHLQQDQLSSIHTKLPAELKSYLDKHHKDLVYNWPGAHAEYDKLVGGIPSLRYIMADGLIPIAKYIKHRM